MLRFDAAKTFSLITEAQRFEWLNHQAKLDQICPAVRHETSVNRNEVLRLLNNWATQLVNGKAGRVQA